MNRATPLLLISLLASACAVSPDDDDVVELDGKADGIARPTGIYSSTEATEGQVAELMLFPDHTFLRYVEAEDFRIRGTFQFTKSTTSSKRYIRFSIRTAR
jgi:tetraacyldisaccharide-1-P 4'-kinase